VSYELVGPQSTNCCILWNPTVDIPRHGLWVFVLRSWPELKYVWPPCIGTLTVKYSTRWNFKPTDEAIPRVLYRSHIAFVVALTVVYSMHTISTLYVVVV
jgi:hypothetical protein